MDSEPEVYIVVSVGDGASIERLSRATLLNRLNEGFYGAKHIWSAKDIESKFRDNRLDLMASSGLFIIKGDLIVPKAKTVVETWEL